MDNKKGREANVEREEVEKQLEKSVSYLFRMFQTFLVESHTFMDDLTTFGESRDILNNQIRESRDLIDQETYNRLIGLISLIDFFLATCNKYGPFKARWWKSEPRGLSVVYELKSYLYNYTKDFKIGSIMESQSDAQAEDTVDAIRDESGERFKNV